MKKILIALTLMMSFAFSTTFNDAVNAYKKGDFETAFLIWQDLANKGNMEAQFYLGVFYETGNDAVKSDHLKALEWYEKAAIQGYTEAQFYLAAMYDNEYGVKHNKEKAKEWYGKACDGGNKDGCDFYKELNQQGY